jgi:two-component system sensor histidine kinase TctE
VISGSLRGRLLWWLLLPLALFVTVSGALSYQNMQETADLLQDNVLLSSVRVIGEDIDWDNGNIVVQIPPAALELFESPDQDNVFYRVEGTQHRLLAGNPDLRLPAGLSSVPVFYTTTLDDGAPKRSRLRSRRRSARVTPW